MTVHYCDICGKEVEEYSVHNITIEAVEESAYEVTNEEWELCSKCAGKVRNFMIGERYAKTEHNSKEREDR